MAASASLSCDAPAWPWAVSEQDVRDLLEVEGEPLAQGGHLREQTRGRQGPLRRTRMELSRDFLEGNVQAEELHHEERDLFLAAAGLELPALRPARSIQPSPTPLIQVPVSPRSARPMLCGLVMSACFPGPCRRRAGTRRPPGSSAPWSRARNASPRPGDAPPRRGHAVDPLLRRRAESRGHLFHRGGDEEQVRLDLAGEQAAGIVLVDDGSDAAVLPVPDVHHGDAAAADGDDLDPVVEHRLDGVQLHDLLRQRRGHDAAPAPAGVLHDGPPHLPAPPLGLGRVHEPADGLAGRGERRVGPCPRGPG